MPELPTLADYKGYSIILDYGVFGVRHILTDNVRCYVTVEFMRVEEELFHNIINEFMKSK